MLTDIERERKKMYMMTELGGQIAILRNKMIKICMFRSNQLKMNSGSDDTRTSSDESNDGYQASVCLLIILYEFFLSIGNGLL